MFENPTNLPNTLFDEFRRLTEEINEVFAGGLTSGGAIRSVPRGSFPAINVVQTPADVEVYLFAPGIDPKKLNVSVQQNLLTLSGERSIPVDENASYYRQERFSGEFQRAVALGDDVDPDRVEAKYRDGIVQIKLHRRESARPRQIQIL